MRSLRKSLALAFVLSALSAAACGPAPNAQNASRPPLAEQWLTRAKTSYHDGDFDDAHDAIGRALAAAGHDPDIRTLAGRIALTRLEFPEAIKLTEGLQTSEAHGIRGRAYWYNGDVEQAADELEAMLADPLVKDNWARDVAQLARRGQGRHPFAIDGGLLAALEMPRGIEHVRFGPWHVVPVELEGDPILALVATGTSEVILDSNARREPAWVNLRFGGRIEVTDVPALTQDLSGLSRQLGVPIKALLGVNLLRHIHVTFDRRGDQFIVRRQDATPPPEATRVPLWYLRGGGMTLRASLSAKEGDPAEPLLVDSSRPMLLALGDEAWRKAGVDVKTLAPLADMPNLRRGQVPVFKLGGFDLSHMPALAGADLDEMKASLDVDVGGVIGAELLSLFRVTFADEGRFIWVEPDPTLLSPAAQPAPQTRTPMQPDLQSATPGAPGPAAPSPSSAPAATTAPRPAQGPMLTPPTLGQPKKP